MEEKEDKMGKKSFILIIYKVNYSVCDGGDLGETA